MFACLHVRIIGYESDKVVGQILRYMGSVREHLCEEGQNVKGMIICRGTDDKMRYALKMVKNVAVKNYVVDFKLIDR